MAQTVAGIDLGTTYSCIACINPVTGLPEVMPNREGTNTTPSVVCFPEDQPGFHYVGQMAKDSAVIYPERTIQFVKSQIGREDVAATIDGKDYSPQSISALVLKKVVGDACEQGHLDIDGVVITVPAYFGSERVEATKQAGVLAGLNVLGTVQEPVAAAVFYGVLQAEENTNVLVYDLGGGTFDVSVLSLERSGGDDVRRISVVCNDGDHDLGGRLWDDAIIEYLKDEFAVAVPGFNGDFDLFAEQTLRNEAEAAKKALSNRASTWITLNLTGRPVRIELARETFDELTAGLLQQTLNLTHRVLENAKGKGVSVEKVLLVGGSTLMPQVREALEAEFPGLPIELTNPHEAVARGAAICALSFAADSDSEGKDHAGSDNHFYGLPEPPCKVEISMVTSKSYGIALFTDASPDEPQICNAILKNTPLPNGDEPYVGYKSAGTKYDGQTGCMVRIFENDEEDMEIPIDGREPLVEGEFTFRRPKPKDERLPVKFELTREGILTVTLVDEATGEEFVLHATVSNTLLSEEEMRAEQSILSDLTLA